MNKKFLSLVLALVMVLGTFGNVFAAAATDKKEVKEVPKLTSTDAKVQWLIDNKIVVGIADKDGKATGDMDLTSPIRRDAAAKMLVYAIGEKDFAEKIQGVYSPFPDVKVDNIMNGLITAAATKTSVNGVPLISGYEDGMFRPTKNVTYAELAKMLVVAIDKDLTLAKAKAYSWPQGWVQRAAELDIFAGLSIADANKDAVRKDAFAMIYNAFAHLKELKAVPANEMRGVISERSNGEKITLNQGDYKVEYKVNDQTIFVNQRGIAQKWLAHRNEQNNYYVGSVVRVLADKEGVATHIIEMGNPVDGIKNRATAWVDLGNKTLDVKQSAWNPTVKDVKLNKDDITFGGAAYEVNSKTEFYVADYDNNVLTKVKDYAAAKKLVADDNDMTYNVYLAYEKLPASGVREARVVVFNKADIEANTRLVRVAKTVSSPDYLLTVNAPGEVKTADEQFSTRNNNKVWPYNYNYNILDVVKLAYNGNEVKGSPVKVIDYEKDNIYKIVDFKLIEGANEKSVDRANANAIVLADYEGFERTYDLAKDYDKFFGNQLVKGAHVQIATRNAGNIIDVISEVGNADLRGHIPNGVDTKLVKGIVTGYQTGRKNADLNSVQIRIGDNKRSETFVTKLALSKFSGIPDVIVPGTYVEVEVDYLNKDYTKPEIVKVVRASFDTDSKKFMTLDEYNIASLIKNLERDSEGNVLVNEANKNAIVDAINSYNKLSEETKNDNPIYKGALNGAINSYNSSVTEGEKFDLVR